MDMENIRMDADNGGRMPRLEMPPEEGCGCESDGDNMGGMIRPDRPCPDKPGHGTPCPDKPCQEAPCVGHEGCDEDGWGLCRHPLAMVYAPCQYFRGLYDPATALSRGTLFEELDLPLEVAPGASCPLDRRG